MGPGASDYGTGSGVTNFYISATFTASIYVQAYLINASDRRMNKEINRYWHLAPKHINILMK